MNRRRFLASAAALPLGLTAGCVGTVGDSLLGSDPHPRRVSVSDVGRLPDELAFAIDAELPTAEVTDRHPATLALTATNEGETRRTSIGTDGCRPFNRNRGRSDGGGLWLYPARDEPTDRIDGRWEFDPDGDVGYAAYGCSTREWAAGETRTYVYAVWDDFRTSGYYEPGTYRWELPVRVAPAGDENAGATGDAEPDATWALELRVTDL